MEPDDREVTDAATILEFLAWGRRKQVSFISSLPSCSPGSTTAQPPSPGEAAWWPTPDDLASKSSALVHVQILLPDRRKVYELVNYHLDSLLWYHGSFHRPTFLNQLDAFYNIHQGQIDDARVDTQWVALLFAVLTASMCCANAKTVRQWGFRATEQVILSQKWLQATTKCLDVGGYMANFSILSCQAVATLTMSAHLLGFSNQQAILLASVTRIAQSLGLHRLNESSDRTIEVETGRRVWSQLCTQDWFSITFSECYLISPLHTSSIAPLHCDDETLEDVPADTPTITSYCRYLHSISSLMPHLQDGIESSNTLFTKYEQVLSSDRAVRELASRLRPTFLSNVPVEPDWPSYVPWARSAAAISSSHKIIMVHRKFLSISFTNNAFAFTRRTCIAASKTILKEFQRGTTENGPILWIYHAFAVGAGITLCLEMLHSGPRAPAYMEHHRLALQTIQLLEQSEISKIASRGAWLLSRLIGAIPTVDVETEMNPSGKRSRPSTYNLECGSSSSKRQKVTELLNVVHYLRDASESINEEEIVVEPSKKIPNGLRNPSASNDTPASVADFDANVNHIFEDEGNDPYAARTYAGTNDFFSRLNVGITDGSVDAFESLLNLSHNYGSTI